MLDMSIASWLIVLIGGVFSGFIDSIAGGGGLISLPVLLSVGVPPLLAIGTNKVQSVFGTATATIRYRSLISWKKILPGIVMSLAASCAGAWTVKQIDTLWLNRILPFILLALWFYVVFKKNLGHLTGRPYIKPKIYYPAAGSIFGFYDGFIGPGTGSFWTISQASLVGMDLKQATVSTKPVNLASNMGALILFVLSGNILLSVGLVMAVGQFIGAWLGSFLVVRNPPRFIYPFFLIVVAATVIKLFWDQYGEWVINQYSQFSVYLH